MKTNINRNTNPPGIAARVLRVALCIALLGAMAPAARAQSTILDGVKIPPLGFKAPRVEEKDLPGGAKLLLLQDDSLPIINLEIYFERGLDAEPVKKAGTLGAVIRLLQLGGAGKLNGSDKARELSRLGAKIAFDADYEYWSAELTTLRGEFASAFALFRDVLLKPELPANALPVVRAELLNRLKQRNNRPDAIGRRKLQEILYAGSRRGYFLRKEDIARLSIESIRADLKRRLRARGAVIAVSGDIRGMRIESALTELLGRLPGPAAPPAREKLSRGVDTTDRIVLVRKQAVQASILIASRLPAHNHADFYALQTGNYTLGGGSFNSRLMREVRVKRGLAYFAYSYNAFYRNDGRFLAASATRVPTTAKTLKLMLDVVRGMQSGVSAGEINLARDAILNSLVFQFENPAAYLSGEVRFRRHGMPDKYLDKFPARIRAVRPGDVSRAARRYLRRDRLLIVVTGPESLKKSLSAIRPVTVVGPEDPPPAR